MITCINIWALLYEHGASSKVVVHSRRMREVTERRVMTRKEIEQALIKEIGNKAGKESVKSRLCRTKGGKPCNASERMK